MRSAFRVSLTCSLLAIYGAVALLGQGLHWLSTQDHHHHGSGIAHCHEHGSGHTHCHHHHGDHSHHALAVADEKAPSSTGGYVAASCDECDICAFLLQIKSERPQIADADIWRQVIAAEVPSALQCFYSPFTLGPQAPRGPPYSMA